MPMPNYIDAKISEGGMLKISLQLDVALTRFWQMGSGGLLFVGKVLASGALAQCQVIKVHGQEICQ